MTNFGTWTVAQLKDKAVELDLEIPKNTRLKSDWIDLLTRYEMGEVHPRIHNDNTSDGEGQEADGGGILSKIIHSPIVQGIRKMISPMKTRSGRVAGEPTKTPVTSKGFRRSQRAKKSGVDMSETIPLGADDENLEFHDLEDGRVSLPNHSPSGLVRGDLDINTDMFDSSRVPSMDETRGNKGEQSPNKQNEKPVIFRGEEGLLYDDDDIGMIPHPQDDAETLRGDGGQHVAFQDTIIDEQDTAPISIRRPIIKTPIPKLRKSKSKGKKKTKVTKTPQPLGSSGTRGEPEDVVLDLSDDESDSQQDSDAKDDGAGEKRGVGVMSFLFGNRGEQSDKGIVSVLNDPNQVGTGGRSSSSSNKRVRFAAVESGVDNIRIRKTPFPLFGAGNMSFGDSSSASAFGLGDGDHEDEVAGELILDDSCEEEIEEESTEVSIYNDRERDRPRGEGQTTAAIIPPLTVTPAVPMRMRVFAGHMEDVTDSGTPTPPLPSSECETPPLSGTPTPPLSDEEEGSTPNGPVSLWASSFAQSAIARFPRMSVVERVRRRNKLDSGVTSLPTRVSMLVGSALSGGRNLLSRSMSKLSSMGSGRGGRVHFEDTTPEASLNSDGLDGGETPRGQPRALVITLAVLVGLLGVVAIRRLRH